MTTRSTGKSNLLIAAEVTGKALMVACFLWALLEVVVLMFDAF